MSNNSPRAAEKDYLTEIGAASINDWIQGILDQNREWFEKLQDSETKRKILLETRLIDSIEPDRKTIQVVAQIDSVGKHLILAVCNDGTVWQLYNLYREDGVGPYWTRFVEPPKQ